MSICNNRFHIHLNDPIRLFCWFNCSFPLFAFSSDVVANDVPVLAISTIVSDLAVSF